LEPKSVGMKEKTHRITEAGLQSWKEAILAYSSQIPALGEAFDTPEKAEEAIQSYWEEWKGIRLLQLD